MITIMILILPIVSLRGTMGAWAMGARQRLARYLVVNPADCPLAKINYQRIMRPKPREVSATPISQPNSRFPTQPCLR